jgi:repressor LexA
VSARRPITSGDVLEYIRVHIAEHGYAPSIREIAAGCGMSSTGQAHYHVARLREIGAITLEPGKARTIRLLAAPAGPR